MPRALRIGAAAAPLTAEGGRRGRGPLGEELAGVEGRGGAESGGGSCLPSPVSSSHFSLSPTNGVSLIVFCRCLLITHHNDIIVTARVRKHHLDSHFYVPPIGHIKDKYVYY